MEISLPNIRIIGKIGSGGMASVYEAYDELRCKHVAVKILNASVAASDDEVGNFLNEAEIMTKIEHPGIVHAYDVKFGNGFYYIIMDLVKGYPLSHFIKRYRRISGDDALIIAESVADALAYAWNGYGVVHCDLKPENIMVDFDGSVKIADLGLVHSSILTHNPNIFSKSDEVCGTPAYISPEQVVDGAKVDCRADIYSLGAALYHLTTLHMLFTGDSNDDILRSHVDPASQAPDPREYCPGLSEPFVRLLENMLVKNRDYRISTWENVIEGARYAEEGECLEDLPPEAVSSIRRNP